MNRSLKNLDVASNKIEMIEDLKKLKDLETLDVSSNKISQWTQIVCVIFSFFFFILK